MPISGRDLEDRLRSRLGDYCRIDVDEIFDHQYKLDFIVSRFKQIPRFTNQIGVQVTVRDNDDRKQAEFLDIHQEPDTVPCAVYLEVDSEADNVEGVAAVVYAALISLVFDKAHTEITVIGLRVEDNFSFEFFDIQENIREIREKRRSVMQSPGLTDSIAGEELTGTIIRYNPRGFGFIQCSQRSQQFFFHISNADELLDQRLKFAEKTSPSTRSNMVEMNIPVLFTDVGYTKEGSANPTARNIRLTEQIA